MTHVLVALAAVIGLTVGSFLNVVVHRVPRGLSVVRPASACPTCGSAIRRRDNVPVLSWVLLRARCRECDAPISVRYPAVELLTAAVFVTLAIRFLVADTRPWALPAYLYLGALGVALALIDLETHRLPDVLVLPAYPVLAGLLVIASAPEGDWTALGRAGVGGAGLWLLYAALMVARPGGMGFGDVKLAGVLGASLAWLGWGSLAVGAFGAFLLGGLYSIALVVGGRAGRRSAIPFGPWMVLGAFVGFCAGESMWQAYLSYL